MAVNDSSKFGFMVEGLADIAELISRYAIIEKLYPSSPSDVAKGVERALVKSYAAILVYLSKVKGYFAQPSGSKFHGAEISLYSS